MLENTAGHVKCISTLVFYSFLDGISISMLNRFIYKLTKNTCSSASHTSCLLHPSLTGLFQFVEGAGAYGLIMYIFGIGCKMTIGTCVFNISDWNDVNTTCRQLLR